MPFYTILDWKHRWAGHTIHSEKKFLFYELLRIPRDHILDVVQHYGILKNPRVENYYRVLNIFIEQMKNPVGKQLWSRFYE